MVLFKRKPVQYLPRPPIQDDNTDVWVIGPTGEIFTDYERYLNRMDFYKQKKFICEITGHSGLTFFEALRSQMEESRDVETLFPEPLREPVLRRVQFSTVSRIDHLVDQIYDDFKGEIFPGENVTVIVENERLTGTVREKAKFPELRRPDGSIERRAFSRYFVSLSSRPHHDALVDDDHIFRDKKSFTKQMLRSFIKNTVTREAWTGAPWLVKERIANDYRIDTEVPPHLQYEVKAAARKAQLAEKKQDHNGTLLTFINHGQRLPELKPAPKGAKAGKLTPQQVAKNKAERFIAYSASLNGVPAYDPTRPMTNGEDPSCQSNNLRPIVAKHSPKAIPAPPPPIKYPIEDLEIAPIRDGTHRPNLKFLGVNPTKGSNGVAKTKEAISTEMVGGLLETWEALNVYCEVFQLDSFTFDDYVEALEFTSDEIDCELIVEIHCSVLKILVDTEGKVQVRSLPKVEEEDSEDESEEETSAMPSPEPEPEPPRRTTRSSLNKSAAAELKAEAERERSHSVAADLRIHQAAEMQGDYGWMDRLAKRDFRNGGWEIILVGLLNQLSLNPKQKPLCDEILAVLAPLDQPANQETAKTQYKLLDINLKVKILQILCLLTVETKAIRNYMEECNEQMTVFRKERIEWQRNRKTAMEELRVLDDERKILAPEEEPAPDPEIQHMEEDVKMEDAAEEQDGAKEDSEETEDEEPRNARSLRRSNDRAAERKRKREEEKEKKEKKAKADKGPKLSPQYKKVLREIEKKKDRIKECEEEISTLENDLREADCARTRVLGRDRFWNRYYWLERNGMPYAGLPTSSTADAGYANGCLWVQGPDEMELRGFIDLPEEDLRQYRKAFSMSIVERKRLEEGPTSLSSAREWGYYDDPDSLDMLIGWLDHRGVRELRLRKELQLQREVIVEHMRRRREYLAEAEEKKAAADEELQPTARVSTRTKTYVNTTASYRCLAWKNTMALEELGHLHSDPPRQPRKGGRKGERGGPASRGSTRGGNLSRQGSRYHF